MSAPEDGFGVILSLADLQTKLRTISNGAHQWTAELARCKPVQEGWTTFYAEIWYSNPSPRDMPNDLCYRFPAFRDRFWGDGESFVCLHPGLAVPVQQGLYFEGERLLGDCIQDFESFWPPIREALT